MHTRSFARSVIELAALTALLGGCSAGGPTVPTCETSQDCAVGGVCVEGTCRPCVRDSECTSYGAGASCREGACTPCGEGGCACLPGELHCACRATGAPCQPGLACEDGLCRACPEGASGCACRPSGDACDPGFACVERACTACVRGEEGCDCDVSGGCSTGLYCQDGHCREPASCEALREAGACPPGRECVLRIGVPTCLDTCEPDHRLEDGQCVPCGPDGCTPPATCESLDCASLHRGCAITDGVAACSTCLEGYVEQGGACVPDPCATITCAELEVPVARPDGTCRCEASCGEGRALDGTGECVTCSITCGGREGETGRLHPLATGRACLCETFERYFVPPGEDGRARRCDDDGDGWVGATALAAETSPDLAIATNARCAVQRAAYVELVNEYGQVRSLRPCADGLTVDAEGSGPELCNDRGGLEPIVLVEPDRNDRAELLAADATGVRPRAPEYGTGRAFRAAELNALTRACSTEHADYDGDGLADIGETQPSPSLARTNATRLDALSSFVELHTVRFVGGRGDGGLIISERSRCAAGFPMGYGALDGGSTYWRGCHRQRDARFGRSTAPPGLDFAAFSCEADNGTCEVPIPSTGRPREVCPAGGTCRPTAPYHDACEPVSDWGTVWRGMHHHSQFRCVLVDDSSAAPYAEPLASIGSDGHLAFQRCSLDTTGGFACTPSVSRSVGWAAVRYRPTVSIPLNAPTERAPVPRVLGCVDESQASFGGVTWSSALCPSPTDPAIALSSDFGRIDCPCQAAETACGDRRDDDCDGLVDCADPDCEADACGAHGLNCNAGTCRCPGGATETMCNDGLDNDCDGRMDCADLDCGGRSCGDYERLCLSGTCRCPSDIEVCDGRDNDCDGIDDEGCPLALSASSVLTYLPVVGGDHGTPVDRTCRSGEAIVGAVVRASGTRVVSIQPRCMPLGMYATSPSEFLVHWAYPAYVTVPAPGGTGGTAYDLECRTNEVVVGIAGRAGWEIDAIAFECGTVTIRQVDGRWTAQVVPRGRTTQVGGAGGGPFAVTCPARHVLRELRMRETTRRLSERVMARVEGGCSPIEFSVR